MAWVPPGWSGSDGGRTVSASRPGATAGQLVERELGDEGQAAGADAAPRRPALGDGDGLDPVHRSVDGAVGQHDLGRVGDVPHLGLEVVDAPVHAEAETVVVAPVA